MNLNPILQTVRHLAGLEIDAGQSDRELLHAFLSGGDETAFAALVWRHGAMVLGVCRHVLRHEQDAEDAFQATFLVLARNATAIRKAESLSSWLHGTAHQLSLRAARDAMRRRAREKRASPAPRESRDLAWSEVQTILDEEIQRLPEKYRGPVVLCWLEGKSGPQAARELRVPEGTLWSRLAQARKRLQARLSRRGITGAAVVGVLCAGTAEAQMSAVRVGLLARAAFLIATDRATAARMIPSAITTLVEGAQRAMLFTKIKVATTLLVLTVALVLGGNLLARSMWSSDPPMKSVVPGSGVAEGQGEGKPPGDEQKARINAGRSAPPTGNRAVRKAEEKAPDHKITEIRLERSEGKESGPQDVLTLRADGTATYEGKKNVARLGLYKGNLVNNQFHESFPLLAKMYVALREGDGISTGKPTESVTRVTITVVRNGKREVIDDRCPGLDERLWAFEMAVRGVGADVVWEKVDLRQKK
jgi:RNA polymerase sigma factor (sigma-70 family)